MNRYVKVAVIGGLVGLAALATVSAAFAQGGTPPGLTARMGGRGGYGAMMGGGGYGWMVAYRDLMHGPIAEALGMSLDEFNAAVDAGQTPWQLAQAKGVDTAALQSALQAGHAAALKQAVADGQLTQAQADALLAHQTEMQAWHAANGYGSMMGGRGFRAGAGAGFGPCHTAATPTSAS
jgi:hypothetical protein